MFLLLLHLFLLLFCSDEPLSFSVLSNETLLHLLRLIASPRSPADTCALLLSLIYDVRSKRLIDSHRHLFLHFTVLHHSSFTHPALPSISPFRCILDFFPSHLSRLLPPFFFFLSFFPSFILHETLLSLRTSPLTFTCFLFLSFVFLSFLFLCLLLSLCSSSLL